MENIIELRGINYRYSESIPAVCDISMAVREAERFAVIGANGTGKSTVLQIMAGLIHPAGGEYLFRSKTVSERTLRDKGFLRFFRERVGYVFQDSDVQLFCPTVLDELLYGPLQLELDQKEALERAFGVMQMLNIETLKDRPSYMLSGGEKKKVAIGSVLTMNPEVLLLDEPTNGLDPRTQCFLVELMFSLSESGKTLIIATHDLSLVDELHANVALLSEEHRVEKIGSSEEILSDEDLLLKVNLIHEHMHYHGQEIHKHRHSHYGHHSHDTRLNSGKVPPEPYSHLHKTSTDKEIKMDDIGKLKHLIGHWAEHNAEHAATYQEWAQRAALLGRDDLSGLLNQLAEGTLTLNGLLGKAGDLLKE